MKGIHGVIKLFTAWPLYVRKSKGCGCAASPFAAPYRDSRFTHTLLETARFYKFAFTLLLPTYPVIGKILLKNSVKSIGLLILNSLIAAKS